MMPSDFAKVQLHTPLQDTGLTFPTGYDQSEHQLQKMQLDLAIKYGCCYKAELSGRGKSSSQKGRSSRGG
jgi:hypothetical protein